HAWRERARLLARRWFLRDSALSLGAIALGALESPARAAAHGDEPRARRLVPRAKNVLWLHMEGAPPTLDMFDRKPLLDRHHGEPCPDEFLQQERFAFIQGHPTLLGHQHG